METYHGHVRTPGDAIILFEACRVGLLPRVQRRLSEKERQSIKSGSVFVWDEREAGMRRWTDGKSWSASRVSGSFLTYREMEGKRGGSGFDKTAQREGAQPDGEGDGGSGGYSYKPDGLIKQSFSITTNNGQHLHLISYFSRATSASNNLLQPTNDPQLQHIRPEKGLYPESTVQEQSTIPAVTRGPMAAPAAANYAHSPSQVPPPYPRQHYGYGPWAPPSPMHTPPQHHHHHHPYPPYYHQPPPGAYSGPAPPPAGPHYAGPYHHPPGPTPYDRPPQPAGPNGAPPPGHHYPPPPNYHNAYPPYAHPYPYNPPPVTGPHYPPPPHYAHGAPRPADTEQGPEPAPLPPPPGFPNSDSTPVKEERQDSHRSSESSSLPPPPPMHHPAQLPPPQPLSRHSSTASDSAPELRVQPTPASTSGQTIPSISAMLNGGPSHRSSSPPPPPQAATSGGSHPSGRSASNSPPAQRALQDIPSHKLGFEANRDVQALRNLDKSTFKY